MSAYLSNSLVLDGYRLIRFLGRGGFGEVWLCQSVSMGDYRALKFILIIHADRLEKEYDALLHYRKAAAQLRSPHLVPIEHVNRNDAGLYYVMPLADGSAAVDPADQAWSPVNLATTLYALLTGNSPDKMGRAAFVWPPQGEHHYRNTSGPSGNDCMVRSAGPRRKKFRSVSSISGRWPERSVGSSRLKSQPPNDRHPLPCCCHWDWSCAWVDAGSLGERDQILALSHSLPPLSQPQPSPDR